MHYFTARQKRAGSSLVPFNPVFATQQAAHTWVPAVTTGVGRLALAGAALGAGINVYAGEGNETDEAGYIQPSDTRSRLTRAATGALIGGVGAAALKYYRNAQRAQAVKSLREEAVAHVANLKKTEGGIDISSHIPMAYAKHPHDVRITYQDDPHELFGLFGPMKTVTDNVKATRLIDFVRHRDIYPNRAAAAGAHMVADDLAIHRAILKALGQPVHDTPEASALVLHMREIAKQKGAKAVNKTYHPDVLRNNASLTEPQKAELGAAYTQWVSEQVPPPETQRAPEIQAYAERVAQRAKRKHDALLSGITGWL